MTTIYTKPQIDAMAVKIGGEIKAAKTTVTQSQGQSTTYAVSQKMITDSLSAFGTAAYKNVGTAAGNVMEVGAFGLGSATSIYITETTMTEHITKMSAKTEFIYSITPAATGVKPFEDYSMGFAANRSGDVVILGLGMNGAKSGYIAKSSSGNVTNVTFWTDKNTPTSNLPVASIQAGIGAPKIAYKKLTGTMGASSVATVAAHGLDASKILSLDVTIFASNSDYVGIGQRLAAASFTFLYNSTNIVVTPFDSSSTNLFSRPYKILITYEV